MGNRGGQGWGPVREERKNLEETITRNCAEGGKSAPQSWLVVPGVGVRVEGEISAGNVLVGPRRTRALVPPCHQLAQ